MVDRRPLNLRWPIMRRVERLVPGLVGHTMPLRVVTNPANHTVTIRCVGMTAGRACSYARGLQLVPDMDDALFGELFLEAVLHVGASHMPGGPITG